MGKAVYLDVADRKVLATKVTYEDLIILYNTYIEKYDEVPLFAKCDSKHNMPQGRIINRVLEENNVTYNDFINMFGKVKHVRTVSKDYNLYVQKYKDKSNELGHYLSQIELTNNSYGLPGFLWFIKHCPDKTVKSFSDFVYWCGFDAHYGISKEYVSERLISLENELGRHITRNDISFEKIGFSEVVINRIFGNLNNAKKELGLTKTPPFQPKPFEYYKNILTETIHNIYKDTGRKFISWNDIESGLYNEIKCEHKTFTRAFKREGVDIFAYIKSLGFQMNPSNFSHTYTFDDGERIVSSMEYDFSSYLRTLGYEYNKTYFRDVLYRTFSNASGKINCDYCIPIGNTKLYIEVAGIIYNTYSDSWREHKYSSKQEQNYQEKMIKKEKLLIESGCNYLFIFPNEMYNNSYKDILRNKINEILEEAA